MKFPTQEAEKKLWRAGYKYVACLDEAGRGALAGPIFAGAVVFKKEVIIKGVNDSKKLTPEKREELYKIITKKAHSWSVASLSQRQIDKMGVGKANLEVMVKAMINLKQKPDFLLIDAHKLKTKIPSFSIIKGDEKVFSIAAASILAKVSRDRFMIKQSQKSPVYQFEINKGYGTARHLAALKKHGPCPIHRRSFRPLKKIGKMV
jgi:ribonuclease HII